MFDQNLNRFSFDRKKALEVLLYISSQIDDMYKTLKILYFADKMHLSRYGRFINGDTYIAMNNGPVPSESYDIIRGLKGIGIYPASESEKNSLCIEGNSLIPNREPNLGLISASDVECLNEAIDLYKGYSFNKLHATSSDEAYKAADVNGEMDIKKIAGTLTNSEEVLTYLEQMYND